MLRLCVRQFSLPKGGNRQEENEDACAYDKEAWRLAVADGASDAFESRLWARLIVQAFIRQPATAADMERWLEEPIQAWRKKIHWDQLPWYALEKARRGAFSTLVGVMIALPGGGSAQAHWWALAVGDACLFQIRGDEVLIRFPVKRAADFGTTPPLLSTRPDYNRRSLEMLQTCEGECQPGDLFVLTTDAFAAWFLRELEEGHQPWQGWHKLTRPAFAGLVERLRREGKMRDDDVTLLLGRIEKS